ncbi:MAG TPA: pantetheine-phosphate adenylyltransferase [Erysipelotrichaceae bacterium]|nr:pantetheine-phosphate adenylyltransferase [Erysipelotrichaceae bacterium]
MKAVYPGTFDPITKGHLDIIERAACIFDEVDVLIMVNVRKQCLFTEEERKQMIIDSLQGLENKDRINVRIGSGLTVRFAEKLNADAIIRGIRAVSDYEYELQQATANMVLNNKLETVFLIAKPEFSFLSSSVVKEIAMNGGDISEFVPEEIAVRVMNKYGH